MIKHLPAMQETQIRFLGQEDPLEKEMAVHSSTIAWKSHGQRSLVGYSLWGYKESDTTERLHFLFSLSGTGEGNGNPLQCSCLENPRDEGAWWAAVYGVAQSRTRLKRLSSSSYSYYVTDILGLVSNSVNIYSNSRRLSLLLLN